MGRRTPLSAVKSADAPRRTRSSPSLDDHYRHLEQAWEVVDSPHYAPLVVANGNADAPVHRWFYMKEAYSAQLVQRVLQDTGLAQKSRVRILDPYCGSGTTGVSLAHAVTAGMPKAASFVGIESNPFLHLAGRAKMQAFAKPPADFPRTAGAVAALALRSDAPQARAPTLSTFHRPEFVPREHLDELLRLRAAIDTIGRNADEVEVDLLLLCLGASVEPATRLRRDGRALRHEPLKRPRPPLDEFLDRAAAIGEDLSAVHDGYKGNVIRGDARTSDPFRGIRNVDLALFSPPYPNNIDYTEVYKLEAWLLGLIRSSGEFADQRRQSVRSHSSLKFDDVYAYKTMHVAAEIENLIAPVLGAVPPFDRYSEERKRVIRGYVDDLFSTLRHVRRCMNLGARLVYVVGNSMHGKLTAGDHYVIASDLLIARLAEFAGFKVDRIEIARRPQRRSRAAEYLRESVVFATAAEYDSAGPGVGRVGG